MSSGYPVDLKTLISGENQSLGALEVIDGVGDYEAVTVSSERVVLGTTGAAGDYVNRLICVVATSISAVVQLHDGTSTLPILQTGTAAGTYVVPLGIKSTSGAWRLTTNGPTVIATGAFT